MAESVDLNDMLCAFDARFGREKGCLLGSRDARVRKKFVTFSTIPTKMPRECV